jgi:hypothetical protein
MPAGGTPEAVVDAQLAAFNRRDLEAFLGFFAPDAKLYEYPGRLTQAGLEQIRRLYARRFSESRDLHATISQRIVQGNFVVDQDELGGVPGGPRRAIVIHQIEAGRIVNVWFIH